MSAARRVALVTGGNKGIGYQVVRLLASADPQLTVLLGARDLTRGQDSCQQLSLPNVSPLQIDVTEAASIDSAVEQIRSTHGGLDLLVANAGIFLKDGKDTDGGAEYVDETLKVNYYGVRDCVDKFAHIMREKGRIVCVSSELAKSALDRMSPERRAPFLRPDPTREDLEELIRSYRSSFAANSCKADGWNRSAYGLSKAAVSTLCQIVSRSPALTSKGVTINSACPGWCRTDMTSDRAPRSAEEGASLIVHVCTLPEEDRTTGAFFEDKQISSLTRAPWPPAE